MSSVTYKVILSFDELENWHAEWDNFTMQHGGSFYMSFDWCRVWWKFYGEGKDLRILTFHQGDELLGILPMYIDTVGVFPIGLRVARLVGASNPPRVFDPPVQIASAEEVFGKMFTHFLENERCDAVSFGPMSGTYQEARFLERAGAGHAAWLQVQKRSKGCVHTLFSLPGSFPEYLASLEKGTRKMHEYEFRALKKHFTIGQIVVQSPERIEAEFDAFIDMHKAQWQEQSRLGYFRAWPKATDFNRAMVRVQGQRGRVRFVRLIANDVTIAHLYCFRFGDRYYWELPARAPGNEWKKFSLGRTGLVCMIAEAIAEGAKEIEGGVGQYDYKIQLGAKEMPATSLHFVANRTGSRVKFKIWELLGALLLLLYHKIWYARIQPRLPLRFQRAKWPFSVRINFLQY